MDALALLCNLHADGPATLEKLRRNGRRTIESMCEGAPEEIAGLLGISGPAARRLQREARLLVERLPDGLLEREGGSRAGRAEQPRAEHPSTAAEDAESAEDAAVDADEEPWRAERASKRGVVQTVLEVWRSRDAADPPEPLREPVRSRPAEGLRDVALQPQPRPSGRPLVVGMLDGLTAERLAALARVGCTQLETLAEADPLSLAGPWGGGLSFTLAMRLRFMARQLLDGGGGSPVHGAAQARPRPLSPAPPRAPGATGAAGAPGTGEAPPDSGTALDAGGPFA